MDWYEFSDVNLGKSKYICFELLFKVLKEETMKNSHNQNVAESAHYITVFYTQESGTCFGDIGILV